MWCSMMGNPPMGNSGLGISSDRGRNRVPKNRVIRMNHIKCQIINGIRLTFSVAPDQNHSFQHDVLCVLARSVYCLPRSLNSNSSPVQELSLFTESCSKLRTISDCSVGGARKKKPEN